MADTDSPLTEPQRAWIAALRSGEYQQTIGVLCRLNDDGEPVGFCCLGVACELAVAAGVSVRAENNSDMEGGPVRAYDGFAGGLPLPVTRWLGVSDSAGGFAGGALSHVNDAGETFERIADIIESRPEGLFAEPTP